MNTPSLYQRAFWLNAIVVGALAFSSPSYAITDAERDAKLAELRQTIEKAQEELKKIKSDRATLETNLQESETKIGDLNKKVNELKTKLEDKQSHLDTLRTEKEALSSIKKQQEDSVEKHLNAAYRLGHQNHFKMLLNQEDPAAISRNLKYYQYLMTAQADRIQSFARSMERISTLEPEIDNAVASLNEDQSQLIEQREQLLNQQNERKRTLETLASTIANKGGALQTLDNDRNNLETLVKRMRTVEKAAKVATQPKPGSGYDTPFATMKGKLPWPTTGQVLRSFGSSRSTNKMHWQGILIGAEEGNPVYAVHQGKVVFSDYFRGHGLLLIIDHGDGFLSLYAHNQTLYKKLGDTVAGGEQIAAVGLSGGQTHAGLYFEMRYKGEPTNPQPWLKKAA